MNDREQTCPTCGNGYTYHNCADLFHAPWKTNPPGENCPACHGYTDDCPVCLGAASRGEYQRVETPAAEPAETNANVIGSCAGSSPAEALRKERGSVHGLTCVHHTDAERLAITCPVCLRAELEQTRRELAEARLRLQEREDMYGRLSQETVKLSTALTVAEQELAAIETGTLVKLLRERLAAAEQRAEEAERHDEQMNVALGKLTPKGTWLCEVLENIWRAPSQDEAVKIAEAAAPEVKAGGLWSGPRVRENLEEAERQRDTAIRERDALSASFLDAEAKRVIEMQKRKEAIRERDGLAAALEWHLQSREAIAFCICAGSKEMPCGYCQTLNAHRALLPAALAAKTPEGGV